MIVTRIFYLMTLILAACNLAPGSTLTPWPTATTVRATFAPPVETLEREMNLVVSPPPSRTAAAVECIDEALNPRYAVVADVNYARHQVSVVEDVHFVNPAAHDLKEVVFVVEPNRWPDTFSLDSIESKSQGIRYELTGRRLTVSFEEPLPPGCPLELTLRFRLNVPPVGEGLDAYRGYFGYSPRQLNLGHWLPVIAAFDGTSWIVHDVVYIGEQSVLPSAEWDVTVSVVEAARSLKVAGPGEMQSVGDLMWRFKLREGRDFTLSMSELFNLSQQETENGTLVELYSFPDALVATDAGATVDAAARSLEVGALATAMFEDLFGPSAYGRVVIVQGDFPDGMEFSGLVFVSGDWFRRYDGTPAGYLVVITVHEIAHQWWYAQVGSDAALYPWLDEALATYSEYIFIEEYFPDLKDWWWQWRVDRLSPQGFVDSNVYQFSTIREYINAVYLRGVRMLHELRQAIGTDAFFALLRRYAEAGAGRLVTPDVFWSLLTSEQWEQTRSIRERYFQNLGLLGR